jgi:hypothetical protein
MDHDGLTLQICSTLRRLLEVIVLDILPRTGGEVIIEFVSHPEISKFQDV